MTFKTEDGERETMRRSDYYGDDDDIFGHLGFIGWCILITCVLAYPFIVVYMRMKRAIGRMIDKLFEPLGYGD